MRRAREIVVILLLVMGFAVANAAAQSRAGADPRVKAELSRVDHQIAEAETESVQYSGGLLKSLVESRLAILRQTRALLGKRATPRNHDVGTGSLRAVEAEIQANQRR